MKMFLKGISSSSEANLSLLWEYAYSLLKVSYKFLKFLKQFSCLHERKWSKDIIWTSFNKINSFLSYIFPVLNIWRFERRVSYKRFRIKTKYVWLRIQAQTLPHYTLVKALRPLILIGKTFCWLKMLIDNEVCVVYSSYLPIYQGNKTLRVINDIGF